MVTTGLGYNLLYTSETIHKIFPKLQQVYNQLVIKLGCDSLYIGESMELTTIVRYNTTGLLQLNRD